MIWLWVKPRPGASAYCFFYQHHYPELRGGMYVKDFVSPD